MAFKRTYGKVSDTASLAAKAGAADQAVIEQQQDFAIQKFMLQKNAQAASEIRSIQHDIELRQFEADLNFESQKSQRAWELEKQMQRSQQQFGLLLQKEAMDQQQLDQKLTSVQEALDNGQISEDDANALRTKLNTGTFAPSTLMGMKKTNKESMDDLATAYMGRTGPSPNTMLETRTIGADEIDSTVTFPDGTVKKYINGQVVTTGPTEQSSSQQIQQTPAEQITTLANEPAYTKTGWGLFGKTTPNPKAMGAKMFMAMSSPKLNNQDKMDLQRVLSSDNPEATQAFYEQLVSSGVLAKEKPAKGSVNSEPLSSTGMGPLGFGNQAGGSF